MVLHELPMGKGWLDHTLRPFLRSCYQNGDTLSKVQKYGDLAGLQKRALMVALGGLRWCLRTICIGVTAPKSALPLLFSL